jgi:hypothetical protein
MEFPIEHQDFAGRGLCIRAAGFFKGPRLLIDGAEVKGKRRQFSLHDNSGIEREIRLKFVIYDPVPKVEIDGQLIVLAQPLPWYQIVLIGLPFIVLIIIGATIASTGGPQSPALGFVFGSFAAIASARVFRSDRSTAAKYALNTLVALGAAVAFIVVVVLLPPEDVVFGVEAPVLVNKGDEFTIIAKVENTGVQQKTLVSLDLDDAYLDGIAVLRTEPEHKALTHVAITNTMKYRFDLAIEAGNYIEIRIYAIATKRGDYNSNIYFSTKPPVIYLDKSIRTVVE